MSKLGVYLATYGNPVMLRHCLLQILCQSRLPDVVSIHENAGAESYQHLVQDVLDRLSFKGVHVIYRYTPQSLPMPTFFIRPLQELIDADCALYCKVDHDDLLFEHHFAAQEELIFNPQLQEPDFDYAMNANSELLVLLNQGGYKHSKSVDFGIWNPIGAHPNSLIFNKAVAKDFVAQLSFPTGLNDDAVFAKYVMPKFKGLKVKAKPTSCFVAHGRNVSVANWSEVPPSEAM
jgi:hypothetical protein